VQLVSNISNLCDPDTPTYGRTDDLRSQDRAVHYGASRGNNFDKKAELAYRKDDLRCAYTWVPWKISRVPVYAHGYFSRNL